MHVQLIKMLITCGTSIRRYNSMWAPRQIVGSIIDYFLVRSLRHLVTFTDVKLVRGVEMLSNHCKYTLVQDGLI